MRTRSRAFRDLHRFRFASAGFFFCQFKWRIRRRARPHQSLWQWRSFWRRWSPIPHTFRNCFTWCPLGHRLPLLDSRPCPLSLTTHPRATGTVLVREGKGLQRTTIQLRNPRRNRKGVTRGIKRRRLENTDKNTPSLLTITHTITRFPRQNRPTTFFTRITKETRTESENIVVNSLSPPSPPSPSTIFHASPLLPSPPLLRCPSFLACRGAQHPDTLCTTPRPRHLGPLFLPCHFLPDS